VIFANSAIVFLKYFVADAFISPFQHTNNANKAILYAMHCYLCFPKKLMPWRDSNPGILVPEADAMPLCHAARRQLGDDLPRVDF
jgi:hypothetical protein